MELENQVCSLDLARKLEQLGVRKGSIFSWMEIDNSWSIQFHTNTVFSSLKRSVWIDAVAQSYPAYTTAELGEMLPFGFSSMKSGDLFKARRWVCGEWEKESDDQHARTEADARAMMLIHLYENGNLTDAA